MPKRKTRIMYLPTIGGRPARFGGDQLYYVYTYARGRFDAHLVPTLREVRRQINASVAYRKARGWSADPKNYGYVRVVLNALSAAQAENARMREVVATVVDKLDGLGDALREDGAPLTGAMTDALVVQCRAALSGQEGA